MLQQLINHSPDLKRLQDEGYELEVKGGYLLIHHIPYVTHLREVKYGILVSELSLANSQRTIKPSTHVINFIGEYPCNADGSIIITGSTIVTQAEGENKVIGKDVHINPPGAVGGHAPPRHERLPNQNGGQNTKVPFLNASKPRPPTAGEKAIIKKVFGDSVDVNKVGIRKAEMVNDRSAVINGDIYFDNDYYVEDFSKTQNPLSSNYDPESGALFVHEMTHVWAGQKGHQNVANGAYLQGQYELYRKTKGQYGFDPYEYSINPNKNFGDYNMEQQGEIIM